MEVITTTRGAKGLPRWFAASCEVLKGLDAGRVDIALPDGRVFRVEGKGPGPAARLDVKNPALFARVAREGELGFCEAYLDGWWDTPDLQALLDVLLSSHNWVRRSHPVALAVRRYQRFMHWLNSNTKVQARRNISRHYDLGNAFYARWLDETMTYSSALFESPSEALAAAQTRKYASICDRIGLAPDDRLLEIGCGWGGFAEYAARVRGARVTGMTISRAQHDFARARVFEAGLAERVESCCATIATSAAATTALPPSRCSRRWARSTGRSFRQGPREAEARRPGAIQVITVRDEFSRLPQDPTSSRSTSSPAACCRARRR